MKERGQVTLPLEPEIKNMVNDVCKALKVGYPKLINACLLHGLLDLDLTSAGKVKFK